jgi:hypothetical protein
MPIHPHLGPPGAIDAYLLLLNSEVASMQIQLLVALQSCH